MSDQHSAGEQVRKAADRVVETVDERDGYWVDAMIAEFVPLLTAATADAKLAGELAGREASRDACESPFSGACCVARGEVPLSPDSAGVLERIKRAERARGAEEAYRRCANYADDSFGHGLTPMTVRFEQWAAEQAAIADGAQK